MCLLCSHKCLLVSGHGCFSVFLLTRRSHHGEELHIMNQVPEGPPAKMPDLLKTTKGNMPREQVKGITGKTPKRQAKRSEKRARKDQE